LIEHRTATVARLNWRGNLKVACVVAETRDCGHISKREISARREQPIKGITESRDVLADPHAGS
jgi:hypothetical protein